MASSAPDMTVSLRDYTLAILVCALTTVLAMPLSSVLHPANLVVLYVLAVALVATWLGRGPAVLASVVAVACFDFFCVPPRYSFTVADAEYLVTFAVMLVVALLITQLTSAYRLKAIEAERRAADARFLHELAAALAGALTQPQAAALLDEQCRRHLAGRAWIHLAGDDGLLASAVGVDDAAPEAGRRLAQAVAWRGEAARVARDDRTDLVCHVEPLVGATRGRGAMLLELPRDRARSPSLPAAVAAVVTTACERIHFTEVAQQSALDMQTERLRSSILSSVAHDLRTPLTVLYGLADALAAGHELGPDARSTVTAIRDHALRMHRTVDNLLDMARLRSGRIELRRDWQSIPDLVGASVRTLEPWLDAGRLRFAWPDDLPLVRVDAVLLERVFCNLLENAAKYAEPGSAIELSAECGGSADSPTLIVHIDDKGPGFAPSQLSNGDTAVAASGFGLGLAICRAIIDAHGGRLDLADRQGGARVSLTLPVERLPPIAEEGA